MRRMVIGLALLALGACIPVMSLRDEASETLIKTTFERLRTGDPRLIEGFTPELIAQVTPGALDPLRAQIPKAAPLSRKPVDTRRTQTAGRMTLEAVDEYDFGSRLLVVDTQLVRASKDRPWQVNGLQTG